MSVQGLRGFSPIGSGGFADVFVAEDEFGRQVAVKANGDIASAGQDGVRIWNPAVPTITLTTYQSGPVEAVVELANGNIASAGTAGVRIWGPGR